MSESSDDDDNYDYTDQPEKLQGERPHEEANIIDVEHIIDVENKESCDGAQKEEEKNTNQLSELKAEWTVHAELRISRPGETVTREFNTTNDPTQQQQQQPSQNPVHVIYKWSTKDDGKTDKQDENVKKSGGGVQRNQSKKSTASKESSSGKGHYGSFQSTAEDSGNFSSASRKQFPYGGTRCRSTCNIILSAVADFLPDSHHEIPEETDPFVVNTTASYTVSPDQPGDYQQTTGNASQNFALGKILALRDATSQTSDTETKYFDPTPFPFKTLQQIEQQQNKQHGGRKRTPYEYRRLTDSLLPSPTQQQTLFADEGQSIPPSYSSSPARTYKSPSLTKIPSQQQQQQRFAQSPAGANYPVGGSDGSQKVDQKKPPRTVHIDVYCTGSEEDEHEEEDDDDDSTSSTTSDDENRNDIESNSTPQTVLDTEQMFLRHQRIVGKSDLPRRFLTQQQLLQQQQHQLGNLPASSSAQQQQQNIPEIDIGHAITKSTTAEEISESKQILFKKHIGDQRMNKMNLNRNHRNVRKDPSDDAISSNYPNSSRSTMRDLTCSSLSSAVAPSHDIDTSSWKETEPKSDSFEYENSVDQMRIRSMERHWSLDLSEIPQNYYTIDTGSPQYHLNHQQQQQQQQRYQYPQQQQQQYPQQQQQYPQQQQQQQYPQSQQYPQQQQHYSQQQQQYQQQQLPAQSLPYQQTTSPQMHPQQQARIQHFLQSYQPQPNSEYPWRRQPQQQQQQYQTPEQYSEFQQTPEYERDHYTFSNKTIPERDEPPLSPALNIPPSNENIIHSPYYQQLPFAAAGRGYRYGSEDRPIPFDQLERRRGKVMFTADYNKSGSEASTLQSNLSGYTTEYLTKARRFGSVVTAMKKPGHHIGPAKNPECQCEHCRRWVAERSEGRGRAYSLGDTPRGIFWLSRND